MAARDAGGWRRPVGWLQRPAGRIRRLGIWRDPRALRADADTAPSTLPSRRQSIALLAVFVVVAGLAAVASVLVHTERARYFDLVHGSVYLADGPSPVAVDLASARPTLRLLNADKQVGVTGGEQLSVVPQSQGTLLLNGTTGEFNMIASSGFLIKHDGSGVPLPSRSGPSAAVAIPAGPSSYIERTGPTGTDVFLVDPSTVQTAADNGGGVRPRASATTTLSGSTAPGAAASAGGHLWLLLGRNGDAGTRTVRELRVPSNSSTGAVLSATDHGQVTGPAAIAAGGPTGQQSVAVASGSGIEVFTPDHTVVRATIRAPEGLSAVVPVRGVAQGRLAFLLHGTGGWSIVSVSLDGHGVLGPARVRGVPTDAHLASPVAARGLIYTADASNGRLYRLDANGVCGPVPGAASYPVARRNGQDEETHDLSDVYLFERGARVFVNSSSHVYALAVFADGSRPPRVIAKNDAVDVSASGSAEELARNTEQGGPLPPRHRKRTARTAAPNSSPINNHIDCATVKQRPHVPVITQASPGSRSVALSWTYPLLDSQDCAPSTYVVSVRLVSGDDAPHPPSSVQVQGQTGVNLIGLYPSTQYAVTVTAYLHGEGTTSLPQRVTTGPAGPAAPTNLTVSSTSDGNWHVGWSSCGNVRHGCVPASTWKVVPSYCDGRGLGAAPDPIEVTADPTSRRQAPVTYRGSDALLGRGLRFEVEGTSSTGAVGTPSSASECVYSYRPPDPTALTLQASTKPLSALGDTTSATVRLGLGSDPVRDLGGVGAHITYELLSGGSAVSTMGPTTHSVVTFTGLSAGQRYQAEAVVTPPHRTSPRAVVGPIDVDPATAPWPTIGVSATSADDNNDGTHAELSVSISGLTSSAAQGEKFDLVDSSLTCGNTSQTLTDNDFDPADTLTFPGIDRTQYNGSCTVQVKLQQDAADSTDPPLFGAGTTSNAADDDVSIDPPLLLASPNFSASWDGSANGNSQVQITSDQPLLSLATNWTVSITDPDGDACGGYSGHASLDDAAVDQSCVDSDGASGSRWDVAVSYTFFGSSQGPYTATPITGGAAPTYNPPACTPTGFNSSYGATLSQGVQLSVSGSSDLSACSQWSYELDDGNGQVCSSATGGVTREPTVTFDLTGCSPDQTWTVTARWQDASGNPQTSGAVNISGQPPDN